MADATGAISLYAVRLRVARLNASGAPIAGADMAYITDTLVRVDFEPTYTTIDAVTKTNGRGGNCLNIPERSVISGANVTVEVCEDDPSLNELLAGGTVLTSGVGADIVGYQYPKSTDPDRNPISIEVWTEAWSGSSIAADFPHFWYALPGCRLKIDARSASADPDTKTFSGTATENPNWGNGPFNDWTYDSGAAVQFVRTTAGLPTVTNGYGTVPTQS